MSSPLRVLIVDDDPSVRAALQLLLSREAGVDVVGELTTLDGLLDDLSSVDVVLLDADIPALDYDLLASLRRQYQATKVIVLSGSTRQDGLPANLVESVVSKMDGPDGILSALLALLPEDVQPQP